MKVTDIERIVVDVPFTPRQQEITTQSVSTVYNWSILELCRVTTDTGHIGWGETVIHYTYGRVTDEGINRVLGASPAQLMNDDSLGAGLQMALFDVVGQILEVPVYELLGMKVRDDPPISWWSIDASPENWAAEAEEAVKHGYTSFKNKPRPWWDIVKQVDEISKVVPTDFKLDLDPNGSFRNDETAIPIMSKLIQYDNVAMFETPIPQEDIPGNKKIRQAIDRPLAMHFGSPAYLTSVQNQVCDGYVIGGGKSTVMRQGLLSAEAEMPFWLQLVGNGLTTTWAAHLGAVLTHANWPAITCVNLYSHHLLQKPVEVNNGSQKVPDAPGLGVEVNEDAVEKYRVSSEELRKFQQKDGCYIHPKPEIIHTVIYPNGKRLHMAGQGLSYFKKDHVPAQAEGTRLELWFNDGSKEWQNLHQKVQENPILD